MGPCCSLTFSPTNWCPRNNVYYNYAQYIFSRKHTFSKLLLFSLRFYTILYHSIHFPLQAVQRSIGENVYNSSNFICFDCHRVSRQCRHSLLSALAHFPPCVFGKTRLSLSFSWAAAVSYCSQCLCPFTAAIYGFSVFHQLYGSNIFSWTLLGGAAKQLQQQLCTAKQIMLCRHRQIAKPTRIVSVSAAVSEHCCCA